METVPYELRSKQGKWVNIPVGYEQKAESLVKFINFELLYIYTHFHEHRELENPRILIVAMELSHMKEDNPNYLRLMDRLLLKICIRGLETKIESCKLEKVQEIKSNLIETLKALESNPSHLTHFN